MSFRRFGGLGPYVSPCAPVAVSCYAAMGNYYICGNLGAAGGCCLAVSSDEGESYGLQCPPQQTNAFPRACPLF